MTETKLHCFEKAGLGKAPFKFVGCREIRGPIRTAQKDGTVLEVGSPGQPMGTCKYCGQGIAVCCFVKSSDGEQFMVGSDCINRVGDEGLTKQTTCAVKAMKKAALDIRNEERIVKCREASHRDDVIAALDAKPHPRKFEGQTLLDWCGWMMANSGTSGRIKVCRVVEKVLQEIDDETS